MSESTKRSKKTGSEGEMLVRMSYPGGSRGCIYISHEEREGGGKIPQGDLVQIIGQDSLWIMERGAASSLPGREGGNLISARTHSRVC